MDLKVDAKEHLVDLVRLNELWIQDHFRLEEADVKLARDPESILRAGGHTLTAVVDGTVVGAAALFASDSGEFELARMAVAPSHRGQGIGRFVAVSALKLATDLGSRRVFLLSNTRLNAAICLYRSLGFETIQEAPHPEYARCNIVMEKLLGRLP